jgi:membrane associated rhomboid family serine protease
MFAVPIERDNPVHATSWGVYVLVATNALIFLALAAPGAQAAALEGLGFVPARPSMLTVFTSMFLHASLLHLLGNLFFLWMFGDNVEDLLGPLLFVAVYLLCGACGAALWWAFNAASTVPCVGASGAISGLMGLYLVFFPGAKTDLIFFIPYYRVSMSARAAIGIWFAVQIVLATALEATGLKAYVGIALWAHVGGFLAGLVLGAVFVWAGFRDRYLERYARTDGVRV